MNIIATPLDGLNIVETKKFMDDRGAFYRAFCQRELESIVGERQIRQINHSRTARVGAVRGMHFQNPPHAEMKMVRCLRGKVWDVAVDLREGSPTFRQWHATELSPENGLLFVIPEGFAHGFQVLEPDSELLYLHTEFYTPAVEGGVMYNDPLLKIDWPLSVVDLSPRDQSHRLLDLEYNGIKI